MNDQDDEQVVIDTPEGLMIRDDVALGCLAVFLGGGMFLVSILTVVVSLVLMKGM